MNTSLASYTKRFFSKHGFNKNEIFVGRVFVLTKQYHLRRTHFLYNCYTVLPQTLKYRNSQCNSSRSQDGFVLHSICVFLQSPDLLLFNHNLSRTSVQNIYLISKPVCMYSYSIVLLIETIVYVSAGEAVLTTVKSRPNGNRNCGHSILRLMDRKQFAQLLYVTQRSINNYFQAILQTDYKVKDAIFANSAVQGIS